MKVKNLTILHISDLHRSRQSPISNDALLDSLLVDREKYVREELASNPDLLIVSGDIVQGSNDPDNSANIIKEQYDEASELLTSLARELFNGDKSRIILIPGNHDISWFESKSSMVKIEEEDVSDESGILKQNIFQQAITIDSNIKWSWKDRSFYRISDQDTYNNRLLHFVEFYNKFYGGTRTYSVDQDEQYDIFDYPIFGVTIVAFNSCFHNDHLNKAGAINPTCIGRAGLDLRDHIRNGRLILATWHHNTKGAPYSQDYMDDAFIKSLIAHDVKISFHGHQHRNEILRAENNIIESKSMLVFSSGTLCGGPKELPPGYNRQYNLVKLQRSNSSKIQLDLYSRVKTPESPFENPVWDLGTIDSSNKTNFSTQISHPEPDPPNLGVAEKLIGEREYAKAIEILKEHDLSETFTRKLLLECYLRTDDFSAIFTDFSDPQSNDEIVALLNACIEIANAEDVEKILALPMIANSEDASVAHLRDQLIAKTR